MNQLTSLSSPFSMIIQLSILTIRSSNTQYRCRCYTIDIYYPNQITAPYSTICSTETMLHTHCSQPWFKLQSLIIQPSFKLQTPSIKLQSAIIQTSNNLQSNDSIHDATLRIGHIKSMLQWNSVKLSCTQTATRVHNRQYELNTFAYIALRYVKRFV